MPFSGEWIDYCEVFCYTICAVSYTHLDVYKRQVYSRDGAYLIYGYYAVEIRKGA